MVAGMTQPSIDRRTALGVIGGLGALIALAACGRSSDSSKNTGATSPSTAGGSSPSTASEAATATTNASEVACVLAPELTEGPYYLDINDVRSDITADRQGAPLALTMTIVDATKCEPIKDAAVDIWHCDALGAYSGVEGNPGTYLRGTQVTDADGKVTFDTVYPGWYRGRAVHIHTKVHVDSSVVHTGQLFFDEAVTRSVYEKTAPYKTRGAADTTNDADSIYGEAGTNAALVRVNAKDDSYTGAITLGLQI
jgi:protocatechuate 3,4-dioxygenase beta subunit